MFDAYYKLEDGKPVGGGNILAMSTNVLSTDSYTSGRATQELKKQMLKLRIKTCAKLAAKAARSGLSMSELADDAIQRALR